MGTYKTLYEMVDAFAESEDPDAMWAAIVATARNANQDVEVTVQYQQPSEYAGRKLRLFYKASDDQQGHQWLD